MVILKKNGAVELRCFSQSRLLLFEMCFKVSYWPKRVVVSKNMTEKTPYNVTKKNHKQNIGKMTSIEVMFSRYLVIFPATLSPFSQRDSHNYALYNPVSEKFP